MHKEKRAVAVLKIRCVRWVALQSLSLSRTQTLMNFSHFIQFIIFIFFSAANVDEFIKFEVLVLQGS